MELESCPENTQDRKMKRQKLLHQEDKQDKTPSGFSSLDENLLFEVFKHADSRTLGMAACVNKMWQKTAYDERLWELICSKQWANFCCDKEKLRHVVMGLGGFRRLYSQFLWKITKRRGTSGSCSPLGSMRASSSRQPARFTNDAIHLSLGLLSIKYFRKMNFPERGDS